MKIEANGEKITVALSNRDMADFDITYAELDYSNIETRRVIWTILDEARRTLGKSIDTDGKLLIEAVPLDDGGCILYFSPSVSDGKTKRRLIMKKESDPILFSAFSDNSFLDAWKLLKEYRNALNYAETYMYENGLYIVLCPKIAFSDMLKHILCEFGDISEFSPTRISEIYEYGKYIKSV